MTTTLCKRLLTITAIALAGLALAATPVHFGPLATGVAFADNPSDSDQGAGNDPPDRNGKGGGGSPNGSGNGNPGNSGPGNS